MEITIFSKKRSTADGKKTFYSFLTTLTRKDGTPCTCSVKFVAPAESPDPLDCPCNIIVDKADCNMAMEDYTDKKSGETRKSYKLWVKAYTAGSPYVDHSMDDFM
mgnify:CR=1 FL=1